MCSHERCVWEVRKGGCGFHAAKACLLHNFGTDKLTICIQVGLAEKHSARRARRGTMHSYALLRLTRALP